VWLAREGRGLGNAITAGLERTKIAYEQRGSSLDRMLQRFAESKRREVAGK